jgi:hypothetical protein
VKVDGDVDGLRMARERLEGKTRRCKLKPIEAAAKPLVNSQARLIREFAQQLPKPSSGFFVLRKLMAGGSYFLELCDMSAYL